MKKERIINRIKEVEGKEKITYKDYEYYEDELRIYFETYPKMYSYSDFISHIVIKEKCGWNEAEEIFDQLVDMLMEEHSHLFK